MTDEEIYQGCIDGERAALDALVSDTREHVERVCAFFLADDEAFPGAVVGAYTRALAHLGKGQKPDVPVKSWLSILATQECFSHLEKLRTDYNAQSKDLEDLSSKIPALLEIATEAKERVGFMIRGDIDEIPDQHKQVLTMSEIDGLHFLELSKRLSCSWSTTLNRLVAARHALAKRVKENFGL